MARTTTEVLIGTGTLYLADLGTAFPADPTVTPAVDWVDIGYSDEGWSFNIDREVEDVEVAEELEPVDILAVGRDVHVVGASAQASLENLKIAFGGGTITTVAGPPAYKKYTAPSIDNLLGKALLLRTNAPNDKVRDVRIPKVIPVGAVEMASKKAPEKTLIAMDFRAVKVSGSDIFEIYDET